MAKQSNPSLAGSVLGLDVGTVRIGVAVASRQARLPRAVSIITHDEHVFAEIRELAEAEEADLIVVGLPRNMDGLETRQSHETREFAAKLQASIGLPITFADESMSSLRAEETSHGYKGTSGGKYLDDIAACLILEEFFDKDKGLQS